MMLRAVARLHTFNPMPTASQTAAADLTRTERRKLESRERLLDAVLRLFAIPASAPPTSRLRLTPAPGFLSTFRGQARDLAGAR
jgi:hypothetical protein